MSTSISIEMPEPDEITVHFGKVMMALSNGTLLEQIGGLVVSQTQRRIHEEKRTPEGAEWPAWKESYAAHRHGRYKAHKPHPGQLRQADNHTMLELSGDLLKSIMYEVGSDEVAVGSNLRHAATQNYGLPKQHVPSRQFLGLSTENKSELDQMVHDYLGALL